MAKILQVCNTDFYLTKFLLPLVNELAAEGHSVDCVCEGLSIKKEMFLSGVGFINFSFPRRGSLFAFIRGIKQMRKIIRLGGYDCVDSHNRNSSIIARVAAWLENVPVNLYTAHGFYFHDDQHPLFREVTIWLEIALGKISDYTLSQSKEDVEFAIRRGINKVGTIKHIGNGINNKLFSVLTDRGTLQEKHGLRSGLFRICCTGRMVSGKGVADLLMAYSEFQRHVPQSELLIIGGNIAQDISPFHQQFHALVVELGLQDHVTVTGITDQVPEYLAMSDIFVLPSYREGVPRSLLEAMSSGLPSIATHIRGCREIINNGINGCLFKPKDVKALSGLLFELYHNPEKRADLAVRGRETVLLEFDESDYIKSQTTAINQLLKYVER